MARPHRSWSSAQQYFFIRFRLSAFEPRHLPDLHESHRLTCSTMVIGGMSDEHVSNAIRTGSVLLTVGDGPGAWLRRGHDRAVRGLVGRKGDLELRNVVR
jgi:hypothetical protein